MGIRTLTGLLLKWPFMAYALVAHWPTRTPYGPLAVCQVPLYNQHYDSQLRMWPIRSARPETAIEGIILQDTVI